MPISNAIGSSRMSRKWLSGILSFSAICTLTGIILLFNFDQTAGAVSAVPSRWPGSGAVERPSRRDTLLVFVHPYCSCTVATLHEIASLSVGSRGQRGQLSTTVLFYRPKNSGWQPGNLWRKVADEIPGAKQLWDDDGREAKRFGARTSGFAVLYDAKGDLLFHGGVTGSRGHEGDNLGIDQLRASIDTGQPALHTSLVFGCALGGADAPSAGENR